MSIARTIDVTCPQCSTAQRMRLWSTVNVTVDPHLKEEALQERLNVFFCSNCDFSGAIDASLFYHDMDMGYCIQYVAQTDLLSSEFYQNLHKDGRLILDPVMTQTLGHGGEHLSRPHHVFSMRELHLYIVFRDLCADWGRER